MPKPVTIHAAKTNLSRLIARACAGEEVIIARGDTPVARLVPIKASSPQRKLGVLKGKIQLTAAFFEPMTAEELKEWGY